MRNISKALFLPIIAFAWHPSAFAQGTGLVGTYYSDCINNTFFKTEKFVTTQTDAAINFNWGTTAPTVASGTVTADKFSIRWKGKLKAPATGAYTFYLTSDDGTRLKVDNRLVIEGMVYQNATTRSVVMNLIANQTYDIQIDYFEDTGPAVCVFEWSGPGIARQVVPTAVLYPDLVTEALAYPRTGWTPYANKIAILSVGGSLATLPTYQIKDASSAVVLSGSLSLMGTQWSNHHYGADLSSLTQPGTYTIEVGQKSGRFKIATDVHQNIPYHEGATTIADMIGSMYNYQRCYHEKCINNGNRTHSVFRDLVVYEVGSNTPTPGVVSGDMYGGWHDATSTDIEWIEMGMTILDMAQAAERVTDPADRAALLSEMRWGADYLLKTQYPAGGWPAQVWPDGAGKLVATPSTGVAGKCVSALAAVSVIYQTSDSIYSQECLTAAVRGWEWMKANPSAFTDFWDGTPGNVLAAAVELARATGQQEYFDFAATTIADGTWASNGYWIKSSGSFPGQKINDYWGQLKEVYWAQTPVALARFHAIAPPATKTKIATLLQNWVNIMNGRMNNPFSAAENMFVSWFGFSQHMLHTAQCLLHIGVNLNNRQAIELGIKNYEFCTGFNPLGGSMGVGFGEETLLPLFYRPQPDSIGGFIPGFKYENNRIHSDFLYSWDSWEVGETGLGSSSALDVLAMMNEQALLDSVPPTPPTRLEGTGWFTEIELRWNGVRSAASYQLKRASTLAGPFVTIADTTALEFTDTGLPSGQIFYYVVSAVGPAGQHADSAPLAVATRTNLAIGKTAATSSTQGGNAPARAVDGLTNTRWESAFSDPQWLRVDLGDDYLVSTFRLRWETASSKSYEVQVSPDGTAWTTAYSTTTGPGGIETHNLATPVEARHIRIYGTQRNTTYGHSLWELEVFGIPANQVIGQATSPQPAVGATNVSRTAALSWLAGQNALMHRVYLGTNLATVTAATPASPEFVGATALLEMNVGMLAAGTTYYWRVDEANAENITTSAVWSFTTGGLPMPPADLSASDVWDRDARLTWSSVPGAASYNLKRSSSVSGPFVTVANTTSLAVTDTALTGGQTYYHVVSAVSEGDESADSAPITVTTRTNLALGKTATTTSVQSGNVPARAIDGLANTRWESQFSDPQWIRIDLGSVFLLDAFRLKWEAASSKSYEIQVSLDDSSWTSIYSTTTGPGGTEKLALTTPAQGRYVRLYGTQRNMIYGHSLWEFEIYGDPALTPLENWRLTWYGNTGNTGNAANTAAPHGNGISNLLVFGLIGPQQNPATAQPSQLPQLVSENNAHRFDFTEPSGVSGISYGADWSATLAPGSWLPLPDLGSGTRHVFEAPSNESRVFMRIVVTNTE